MNVKLNNKIIVLIVGGRQMIYSILMIMRSVYCNFYYFWMHLEEQVGEQNDR